MLPEVCGSPLSLNSVHIRAQRSHPCSALKSGPLSHTQKQYTSLSAVRYFPTVALRILISSVPPRILG